MCIHYFSYHIYPNLIFPNFFMLNIIYTSLQILFF